MLVAIRAVGVDLQADVAVFARAVVAPVAVRAKPELHAIAIEHRTERLGMADFTIQACMPADQPGIVVIGGCRQPPTRGAVALIALRGGVQMAAGLPGRGLAVVAGIAPARGRRVVPVSCCAGEAVRSVAGVAFRGIGDVVGRFAQGSPTVVASAAYSGGHARRMDKPRAVPTGRVVANAASAH